MKTIIITGANGFLGNELIKHFSKNYKVIAITRKPIVFNDHNVESIVWDGKTLGNWVTKLENADTLINLAGKSVDCRYTEKNKKAIFSSRLESTRILGEAMKNCKNPPKTWINIASATIYEHTLDQPNTESTGKIGKGFSVEVCKAWEKIFYDYSFVETRQLLLRTSIVLGNSGGAFIPLKRLTQFGLGGRMGDGNQYISWIHVDDFCKATEFLIENKTCVGTYNLASTKAVRNTTFQSQLRKLIGMPIGIHQPKWLLELGARLIGTETELILKSRFVYPERLLAAGYQFKFTLIEDCLQNLLSKKKMK